MWNQVIKATSGAVIAICAMPAAASDLIYTPINPSFGGNPFYSSHLYQGAEIQNRFKDDGLGFLLEEQTAADLFASAMQSSLIAGATSQITQAIFTDGAPPSGIFTLDGATVSYETVGGNVIISVNDGVTTEVLTVPIPSTSP